MSQRGLVRPLNLCIRQNDRAWTVLVRYNSTNSTAKSTVTPVSSSTSPPPSSSSSSSSSLSQPSIKSDKKPSTPIPPPSTSQPLKNGVKSEKDSSAPPLRYLSHPIGQHHRPRPDENTGIDHRTLKERRADLVNQEKNLQRRQELVRELNRGYFSEWRDMKYHQGKTWVAPPRIFKGDKAGYMPNFYGRTIAKEEKGREKGTTDVLQGKISVVSVYSSAWAQRQAETFTGAKVNGELHEIIRRSGGKVQQVVVNISFSRLKSMLLRLFTWRLRRQLPREMHPNYFFVRKGFTRGVAGQMGMSNVSVGYTYLVDGECRIRWAGNSEAWEGEREALNKGAKKLLEIEGKGKEKEKEKQ